MYKGSSKIDLSDVFCQDPIVRPNQLIMTCPACGKERHFYVHRTAFLYRCFRCGVSGSFANQVVFARRSEWREWSRSFGKPREGTSRTQVVDVGDYHPLYGDAGGRVLPWLGRHRKYAASRGITPEQGRSHLLCAKPGSGRLWFPYWEDGRVVWAMGRSTGSLSASKTWEVGRSEKPLYGIHVRKPGDDVVLVEGVFDYFATPKSYAVMGSDVNGDQIAELRLYGVRRVFCVFDPDAEEKSVKVARKLMNAGMSAYPVGWRENKKDPAELGRAFMEEAVRRLLSLDVRLRPQTILVRP